MAKQIGFLKVEGTVGDITFVKTRDGYLVKQKGGVPASRIATDPKFKRTRENGAEFGLAGKAGKILRKAFAGELQSIKDRRVTSRLHKALVQVLQTDTVNKRGERNPAAGDLTMLNGFEFNIASQVSGKLVAAHTAAIDRVTGELTIDVPTFVPANAIVAPIGSTHFRIRSAGGWVDFVTGKAEVKSDVSQELAVNETNTTTVQLSLQVQAVSTHPIFLLLGIEFLQQVNGIFYPLNDGSFNSMAIIGVDA